MLGFFVVLLIVLIDLELSKYNMFMLLSCFQFYEIFFVIKHLEHFIKMLLTKIPG